MRTTTAANTLRSADTASSLHPPQDRAPGFMHGTLIVAGLVGFWTLLLLVNLVSLPVRLVRRLLRR